jgi:hypothetical protein
MPPARTLTSTRLRAAGFNCDTEQFRTVLPAGVFDPSSGKRPLASRAFPASPAFDWFAMRVAKRGAHQSPFRLAGLPGGRIMGKQMEAAGHRPSLWPARDLSLRKARVHDLSYAELQLSLARERALREQAEEFEHRLFNSV